MNHGSLFSGIGGFDFAAQWMGWNNVFQVEWDEWCQEVLTKNFPDVPKFRNIIEFNKMLKNGEIITDTRCQRQAKHEKQTAGVEQCGEKGITIQRPDIITGGFPCQPFSHAGKRKGTDDSRYLWPEMLTTIRTLKPTYIIGENVAGLVSMDNGKTLDGIFADLEDEGYTVESFIIPACAVGAWHRRDRMWIIAYSGSTRGAGGTTYETDRQNRNNRGEDAKILQGQRDKDVPNSDSKRLQGWNSKELSECTDKQSIGQGNSQNNGEYWQSEPSVGRVADGVPNRVDRLKGLGNAIVPQVAYEIFKAIEQL